MFYNFRYIEKSYKYKYNLLMLVYKLLGERIKEKRLLLGLTQDKLSELCDFSSSYIGIIERGEKRMSIESLVRIANELNVNANYLLSDSVLYENAIYKDKFCEMVSDFDTEEIEFIYDFIRGFRNFRGKKNLD